MVRDICLKYNLSHPLQILENPPKKEYFKKLIKSRVLDYWEKNLRGEASFLPSLKNFRPEYMSLSKPHPIWSTAGSNPHEVSKAIQQARFLSGRYRSENLSRHWSTNREGYCLSSTCTNQVENYEHILIHCKAYHSTRENLLSLWLNHPNSLILNLVQNALSSSTDHLLQFIIDCSVLPEVISAKQLYGTYVLDQLFYLTRTWCFSIHKQRMKMLGRWNFN